MTLLNYTDKRKVCQEVSAMIKQHCFNCGAVFDSDGYEVEYVDGFPVHVCPKCGGDDYREAIECDCGGAVIDTNYFDRGYVRFKNGNDVCDECLHDYCKENFT